MNWNTAQEPRRFAVVFGRTMTFAPPRRRSPNWERYVATYNVHAIGLRTTLGVIAIPLGAMGTAAAKQQSSAQHVLLISVDGMHQTDLAFYIKAHPKSALATLVKQGAEYTRAETPVPSDSFPGITAQVTGGNPSSTASTMTTAGTTRCSPPGPPAAPAPLRAPR